MTLHEQIELLKIQYLELYKSMQPLIANIDPIVKDINIQTALFAKQLQPITYNIRLSTLQLSEKLKELQPIIQNIKDSYYQNLNEEEVTSFNELNDKIESSYDILSTKQPLTPDLKANIIAIIISALLGIFALYQNHVYHTEDSKSDAQFQSQVIQLLQEIADSCHESVESHHEIIEDTQVPIHEN